MQEQNFQFINKIICTKFFIIRENFLDNKCKEIYLNNKI